MKRLKGNSLFLPAAVTLAVVGPLVIPGMAQKAVSDSSATVNTLPKNTVVATVKVGVFPNDLAVGPKGNVVYVVNSHSYTVSVIDTATNSVIATIPVGNTPTHVVFSPDGNLAYVSNFGGESISVLSTEGKNELYRIRVISYFPDGLALTRDGKYLYVASAGYPHYGGFISIINTNNQMLVNAFKPGGDPTELSISPDGSYVYALIQRGIGKGYIDKIDTATQGIVLTGIGSAYFTGLPTGLAISPDGNTLYASNGFAFVLALDASNGSLDKKIDIFPHGSTERQLGQGIVTRNGKYFYVPDPYRGTLTMVDTATNKVVGSTIKVGAFPMYLAVSPDGQYLYASNNADDTVSVVDISQ